MSNQVTYRNEVLYTSGDRRANMYEIEGIGLKKLKPPSNSTACIMTRDKLDKKKGEEFYKLSAIVPTLAQKIFIAYTKPSPRKNDLKMSLAQEMAQRF